MLGRAGLLTPRPSWYSKYVPKTGDGCVLYCPGQDDPQSAVLRDISGNRNNGTITGATWVRLPSGLWVPSLDGTDDKITISHSASLDFSGNNWTLEFWIKQLSLTANDGVISKGSFNTNGFYVELLNTDGAYVAVVNQSGANQYFYSKNVFTTGVPHHCCIVKTGAAGAIWCDGVDQTQETQSLTNCAASTQDLIIGSYDGTQKYNHAQYGLMAAYPGTALGTGVIRNNYNQTRHLFGV